MLHVGLAIHDGDSPFAGVMRSSFAPQQFFVVGRLLTLKRKIPDLKAFVFVEYDGLEDVASIRIDLFPVWVEIKGLLDALMTDEVVEKVGWTLGQIEHFDQMNIRRGTWAEAKCADPGGFWVCGILVHSETGPSTLLKFSFSIPGISAADLAFKLDSPFEWCDCGFSNEEKEARSSKGFYEQEPAIVTDQIAQRPKRAKKISFGARKNLNKELDKAQVLVISTEDSSEEEGGTVAVNLEPGSGFFAGGNSFGGSLARVSSSE
ncbi:hypothetical protein ACLB2K_066117 [Fragaria x ananassa]